MSNVYNQIMQHGPIPATLLTLGVNPTRLEVLRIVLSQPETITTDVMTFLGLTRNGARKHLLQLQRAGLLIVSSTKRGSTRSLLVWTADPDAVADLVNDLDRYLRSSPAS